MIRKLLIAVAALAVIALPASAQTLDEVLANHYKAEGGLEKLRALNTLRMSGKMTFGPGMEAPVVMEKARPNKSRMDFTVQGMTGTQAYDGKSGWMLMPFGGKKDPEPMPDEMVKQMEEDADFDGPLIDWKTKGHTIELLGKEETEGAEAYKLKVTLKTGSVSTYYIDADTYLIIKTESKRRMRGAEVDGESSIGDYKPVDGYVFPFAMEMGAKGSTQKQKLTFEKIEVNPALDAKLFDMPAVTKADSTSSAAPAKAAEKKPEAKPAPAKPAGKTDK
jgi:outer membrane lipoprotein-sorting protein